MNEQILDTLPSFKVMLEHKNIMLSAIRAMDEHHESFIREVDYNGFVLKTLQSLEGDKGKQNTVRIALSRDNLLYNHILSDFDQYEGDGRLFFDKAVIDIFRLFDKSLIQELTHIELNTRLVALRNLTKLFDSGKLEFNLRDLDYKEALDSLFQALANLQSLIRRNLSRMEDINQELSDSSEQALKSASPEVMQVLQKENIDQISNLLVRHILPTRTFLDEKIILKDGLNLLSCLDQLRLLFDTYGMHSEASTMLRYAISFNAYHKEISRISISIDQFLARSRKRLTQFNAIENAFTDLIEYLDETTQDLRRKKIRSTFANSSGLFLGLKNQPRPKDLRLSDSPAYFNNVITDISARIEDRKLIDQLDFSLLESSIDDSLEKRLERVKKVQALIESMPFRECDDLIESVHRRFVSFLDSYHILDLLEGLSRLTNMDKIKLADHHIQVTNQFDQLLVGKYIYHYRKIRVAQNIETLSLNKKETSHESY